jgi:hypothetical protein
MKMTTSASCSCSGFAQVGKLAGAPSGRLLRARLSWESRRPDVELLIQLLGGGNAGHLMVAVLERPPAHKLDVIDEDDVEGLCST